MLLRAGCCAPSAAAAGRWPLAAGRWLLAAGYLRGALVGGGWEDSARSDGAAFARPDRRGSAWDDENIRDSLSDMAAVRCASSDERQNMHHQLTTQISCRVGDRAPPGMEWGGVGVGGGGWPGTHCTSACRGGAARWGGEQRGARTPWPGRPFGGCAADEARWPQRAASERCACTRSL
jgi:hypothetical protein